MLLLLLFMQNLRCKKETYSGNSLNDALVTVGMTGLIPEWVSDKSMGCEVTIELPKKWYWVSDKSMGCEVTIELPKKWYKDDNLLGFALFFHSVNFHLLYSEFSISQGDQFISMSVDFNSMFSFNFMKNLEKVLEELAVFFFPQIVIPNEYRSRRWKYLKVCIKSKSKVKSVGVHPLYA